MKRLLSAALVLAATCAAPVAGADEAGILNPHEGGIAQLRESLSMRPERAGFTCWVVYETQKGGLHKEAMEALEACAATGNAPSMILIAHAYENGLGVETSPERSTHWVKQAALTGYSLGQYHYGMALLNGYGVERDREEARLWLERAAAGGSESAEQALLDFGT